MRLKDSYCYKKKFIQDPSKLVVSEKSQGILFIRTTSNNIFFSLMSPEGKVTYLKSCGALGFKGTRERTSKYAYQGVFREIALELALRKWTKIFIFVRGLNPKFFRLFGYLDQILPQVEIALVKDLTRLPYNGCRLRKERRT